MTRKTMTDEEFDEYFDNGGDITPFIVEDSVEFPNRNDKARKVNISMPEWMIEELDATARHFATTRQGVINMWIGERLENERHGLAKPDKSARRQLSGYNEKRDGCSEQPSRSSLPLNCRALGCYTGWEERILESSWALLKGSESRGPLTWTTSPSHTLPSSENLGECTM